LIWELLTGTFPFSAHPADIDSSEKKDPIRVQLSKGARPWNDDGSKQGWEDVYKIMRDCWDPNPVLCPPASYVAQTLLDIYARRSLGSDSLTIEEVPQEVKDSTFKKIVAKRYNKPATELSGDVILMLHRSVTTTNDPLSSFLMGAAIWWDLVPTGILPSVRGLEYISPGPPPEGEYLLALMHVGMRSPCT
jgi:hypothetical protein